jgi:hypothetical protein
MSMVVTDASVFVTDTCQYVADMSLCLMTRDYGIVTRVCMCCLLTEVTVLVIDTCRSVVADGWRLRVALCGQLTAMRQLTACCS